MFRISARLLGGILVVFVMEDVLRLHDDALFCTGGSVKSKFTCQDDVMHIGCTFLKEIRIYRATYGRIDENICSREPDSGRVYDGVWCNPVNRTKLVRRECDELQTCSLNVNNDTMGDVCSDVFKYLNVIYGCHTLKPTTEALNKSTIVLTKPSFPAGTNSPGPTENPTESIVFLRKQTTKESMDSTSADIEFVAFSGGNRIFGRWVACLSLFIISAFVGTKMFL